MNRSTFTLVTVAALGAASLAAAVVTTPYAADVVSAVAGPAGGGEPLLMTGPPSGLGPTQGSFEIWQMGAGGQAVLELAVSAVDGPGTDLVVYENPFLVSGQQLSTWIECVFVEVSTDNTHWARFPTRYTGVDAPYPPFSGAPLNAYKGFAGVMPVMADPVAGEDPADVVAGGGDAFDFADLAGDADVLSGDVDLNDIRYVRLTDVVGGVATDSAGTTIWDCGDPGFAGADIDAVAVLNTSSNQIAGRPHVELTLVNDVVGIEIVDSDGIHDFKFGITCSWNGEELDFYSQLLPGLVIVQLTSTSVFLAVGPVPAGFDPVLLKVAVTDNGGLIGGDTLTFP